MVHERIVMIGSAREHDRVGARLARGVESGTAPLDKLALEAFLSTVGHANSLARHIFVNTERLAHISAQLAIAIGRREPMEQRRVERHIPRARRIVAALDHHGVSLHHGAHRNACFGTILGWHCRDDGHEDAIDPHASELAHVAMHDLRREAHRVRRDRGQAVFVHAPRAQARELHVEAQRAQKRRPKRRSVPQGQHARQTHGYMALRAQRARGPLFEQKALARRKQVHRRGNPFASRSRSMRFKRRCGYLTARAPIARHKRATVRKRHHRACAPVRAFVAGNVGLRRERKTIEGIKPNKRTFLPRVAIARDKRAANGAHKARIRRTHHIAPHIHLKRAQHGVVGERAALHHNAITKRVEV